MAQNWWLPPELRNEFVYRLKGLQLIEQCHERLSRLCGDDEFWTKKLEYDYKIAKNSPLYESIFTPYELYVLITYNLKYDSTFLSRNTNTEVLMVALLYARVSSEIFGNIDENKDAIDVYVRDPGIVLYQLHDADEENYPKIYKYIWDNHKSYRKILMILDSTQSRRYYFNKDETTITLTLRDVSRLIDAGGPDLDGALIDIYNEQFEEKEDPELERYLTRLREQAEEEEQ